MKKKTKLNFQKYNNEIVELPPHYYFYCIFFFLVFFFCSTSYRKLPPIYSLLCEICGSLFSFHFKLKFNNCSSSFVNFFICKTLEENPLKQRSSKSALREATIKKTFQKRQNLKTIKHAIILDLAFDDFTPLWFRRFWGKTKVKFYRYRETLSGTINSLPWPQHKRVKWYRSQCF